ncbi:hypothetical protein ACJ41O_001821 [Fusarium nematophilum]
MSEYGSSQLLARTLKGISIFSIVTGSLDVLLGTRLIVPAPDQQLPFDPPALALVDSQLRFLGAMWAGYGTLLWWASNDVRARRVPLALLGVAMLAGGVGRLASGLSYGWSAPLKVATAAELVLLGPGMIYLSLRD